MVLGKARFEAVGRRIGQAFDTVFVREVGVVAGAFGAGVRAAREGGAQGADVGEAGGEGRGEGEAMRDGDDGIAGTGAPRCSPSQARRVRAR